MGRVTEEEEIGIEALEGKYSLYTLMETRKS
jgi:hypothetical protein